MTPTTAILLSLLVPGSAHAALGQPKRAVLAFLVTVGMFFAGYAILQDRLFAFVLFEPFDFLGIVANILPINLLPEAPNAGCSIVARLLNSAPDNPEMQYAAMREMRLARPMEHLGFWLTGSSGIVACLFAADAHGLALNQTRRRFNRALAAGLSWVLPGAGHVLAGHQKKGVLMGGAVLLLFSLGLLVSGFATVDRTHHDAYWICQSLFGGGTLVAALGLGPLEVPDPIPLRYSLGYTLTAVAGLMNLVVMVDAYTVVDHSEPVGTADAEAAA